MTVKYAPINVTAGQTDASVVAAVAGKKIVVLQLFAITAGTATDLTFNTKGAGAGTAISPTIPNGARGGEVLPYSKIGWFETNKGEALTVTTGSGATTGLMVAYIEQNVD